MKQIIIGKEGTQPFLINDPDVSRKHATLTIDEGSGRMVLVDNNSTNGTYVYSGAGFVRLYAGQSYPVTLDTMIQLGPNTRFHISHLFKTQASQEAKKSIPTQKQPQKPKRVDIKQLRVISDRYTQRKMDYETKTGTINGLRNLTILISIAAAGGGKMVSSLFDLGPNGEQYSWLFCLLIGFLLWVALNYGVINTQNRKLIKNRNDNERMYSIKYCCPECHTPFKGRVYENILSEGRCPKCKVEYYDSSIEKKG